MGTVFDIKRPAFHDGPGLRTTVFLKGCPLSCLGCHNPEGQRMGPELLFRPDRCTGCGDCVPVCPAEAIELEGRIIAIDSERCDLTGACVEACLPGALEVVGRQFSVKEVLDILEKDRVFFDESRGGVTFSGGEPFSQPEFLRDLLEGCRSRDIPAVLDTCGHVSPDVFRELVPLASHVLFDLKLMDPERHEAFAGVQNRWILDNLQWVGDGCKGDGGAPPCPTLSVRLPLIPGVNDDTENLEATGAFLASLATPPPVDILPYHRLGVDKYERFGREYFLRETEPPSEGAIRNAVSVLETAGLSVTVRGDSYGHD